MRDTQSRQEGDLFTTINAPLHCLCHLSLFLLLSEEPLLCFLIRHQVQHSRSSSSGVTQTSLRLGSPISAIKTHLCLLWGLLRACFRNECYSYIKKNYFFFCPFTCSWICEWFAALGLLKIELVWATTYWFRLAINFIFPFVLDRCLEMAMLGHSVSVCLTF